MRKPSEDLPYITPSELALRWCCSRTNVDRVAKRAKLTRLFLGTGKNGLVRYLIKEVVAYEASRMVGA